MSRKAIRGYPRRGAWHPNLLPPSASPLAQPRRWCQTKERVKLILGWAL